MVLMTVTALLGVGAGIVVPLVAKSVIDGPIRQHSSRLLLPYALLALALGLTEAFLAFVRRWIQSKSVLEMETRIRDDFYAHLQRLPVAFHDRWQSGQLLSRAMTDLGTIRRFVGFGLIFMVVNLLTFATVIGLLVNLYAPLGLLVAASSIPIFLLSVRFEQGYRTVSRRVQDRQGDLATVVEEAATGLRVVKAFGRADHVGERFAVEARSLQAAALESVRLRAKFWSLIELVPELTLVVILLVGAHAVANRSLSLGGLVAFISLMLQLIWPVESLGWILATGQEASTAADRIFEVFDTLPTVTDRPSAVPLVVGGRGSGRVCFEGVGFSYPGTAQGSRPVLHDIDLQIEPGETVAIVGVTGCGKTTLVSLVPRLYDVTSGRITIDGVDIRDASLGSLRQVVSTAFEEPILFSASVRENLTLGCANASDADVRAALMLAKAEFAFELPWGLDTRIGEQGMSLSGGQRQRLALARAVISSPRVLVLDDPLSALDVHTEALIEAALREVLRDVTGLLVVHRPSTLALADRVAFLHDGTVMAVGTHTELMSSVPAYAAVLAEEAVV